MKRFLVGVSAILVVLAIGAYLFRTQITLSLLERVIASNVETNLLDELPDGLHVALCGAGSPFADPLRSGPCSAVIAGEQLYLVDSGTGSSRVLTRMRIPQGEIDGIFLTHFHSDHIDGLGEQLLQRWANGGHTEPVPLYGPFGANVIATGVNLMYELSRRYRVAHHGDEIVPKSGAGAKPVQFDAPADGEAYVVLERDGVKVTAFSVAHPPIEPAVGYRFDYKGRSVVFSGDTVKSANVEKFADGVDLLVHEALSPKLVGMMNAAVSAAGNDRLAAITKDILDYHTSPVEAAQSAETAGVGHLVFNHIVPQLPFATLEEIFVEGVADSFSGPFTLGRDGTLIQMPAGSDSIDVSVSIR